MTAVGGALSGSKPLGGLLLPLLLLLVAFAAVGALAVLVLRSGVLGVAGGGAEGPRWVD